MLEFQKIVGGAANVASLQVKGKIVFEGKHGKAQILIDLDVYSPTLLLEFNTNVLPNICGATFPHLYRRRLENVC
jgi:hypothetical protein